MPEINLSASLIDQLEVCPRRAYMRKVVGAPTVKSTAATLVGQAAHRALERYHTGSIEPGVTLEDEFRRVVQEEFQFFSGGRFMDACAFMRRYEQNNPIDPENNPTIIVEYSFEIEVGGHKTVGFIDRIDYLGNGVYKIVDYKTSYKQKSQWEVDDDTQLMLYALAVRKMWEKGELYGMPKPERVITALYYLRYQEATTEFTDERLEDFEKYVAYVGDYIKSIKVEPEGQLNEFCKYCDYRADCPAFNSALAGQVVPLIGLSEQEIMEEYFRTTQSKKIIEAHEKSVKEAVLKLIDESEDGVFTTEAGSLTKTSKEYKSYDFEQAAKMMPEVVRAKYQKFDGDAFLAEATDDQLAWLEQFARYRSSRPYPKRVGGRKKGV